MSEHERHKYFTSLGHRDTFPNEKQFATDFFEGNGFSPKKRSNQNQPLKKDHISKPANDQINKLSHEQLAAFSNGSDDKKFKTLIIDTISSADRAIKAILPYGHSEIEKYCSAYFLNKEKLLSFIDANNRSFFSNTDKNSRKPNKIKVKRKDNVSSDLTEMVPINHLERLEKIVYNKIMPILQNQFEIQKKKNQKLAKRGKDWANSDLKEGLQLLERLNGQQRIAVDQCAQILQRFIVRIMEKEQKMLNKLNKMQEKLDEQIKKTETLSQESKKWEEYRMRSEKEWNKQKKNLYRYQQFSKEIKVLFSEKDKIASEASEKECLEDILQQIRRMLNNQDRHSKRDKKCDHKTHKEVHASCKEEASKNEQQIKSLKEVVKSLDNQICILRQECENMDTKLQHSHERVAKFESRSKKIIEENEAMNKKIEEMTKEENYKSKLIEEYLRMIAKLEDTLRLSEENLIKLNEENDSYLELIARNSTEKDDYVKQMMEMEDKSKEIDELLSKKQAEIEELVNNICAKQKQIHDNETIIQKLHQEIHELYLLLKAKEQALSNTMKEVEQLSQQIRQMKQAQMAAELAKKRENETSVVLNTEEKEHKINRETLESIQNMPDPINKGDHIQNNILSQDSMEQEPIKRNSLEDQINNRQTATVVNEINDAPLQYNLKKQQRDDFIPAEVNKQTQEEIQKQKEQYESHNVAEKQASQMELDSQGSKMDKQKKDAQAEHLKVDEVKNEKAWIESCDKKIADELYIIDAQSYKIQQLLDLNTRISTRFNRLKEKIEQQGEYRGELTDLKEEMDGLTLMLNMCKRSTLKKLQRIVKTETLHQEAQEEIERLKHRLDDAIIVNTFSNIQQNSDGSGFTIPDHLQSFFKNNIMEPTKFNQQIYISRVPIKPKVSKDFYTQTDAEVQTFSPPAITIESEVVIQTSSPIQSLADDKQEQADKSFINQLEIADISPVFPHSVPRLESVENSNDFRDAIIPNSLKETPFEKDVNPEVPQTTPNKDSQLKQISNLIEYHRQQLINLHKLLRQDTGQVAQNEQQRLQTPQKHALENSTYLKNIMNAPEKQKEASAHSQSSVVEFHHEIEVDEMKEMFTQREQQFSSLVVEKEQQIERLKSIIKTLTKAQEVEERTSMKVSRNKEPINREIQNLKTENEQLWMFLEKQKSEIERLQIIINQYQLAEQLTKINNSRHHRPIIDHPDYSQPTPIDNQGFVYAITPAKKAKSDRAELAQFQQIQLSKSQPLKEEESTHELLLNTERKEKKEDESPIKQSESPVKRFTRKSQKFDKQESPRERRHTSPKMAMQFDWQDLVPQYFGKSKSKSPQK